MQGVGCRASGVGCRVYQRGANDEAATSRTEALTMKEMKSESPVSSVMYRHAYSTDFLSGFTCERTADPS